MTRIPSTPSGLSASQVMIQHKREIEDQWAKTVRQQIASASQLADPILFNYFPNLLTRIAEALECSLERADAADSNTSAQEHGGERARLTNFNITQIASEFYILKETIYSVLEAHVQLTRDDRRIIDRSIDRSLQQSITSFALAESYLREQFIAMLAHDIRGPIAFIKMASSLLREGVASNVESELYLRIADAAENAGSLIDNILDATLIKASQKIKLGITFLSIADVIDKAVHTYQQPIQVKSESVEGYWCPIGLTRALHNLVDNAVKYGDNSQPITIQAEQLHGALRIAVHNKGPPIPIEEQESIFQPFHRSQATPGNVIKGWGFGLPIVRGITEAHGGSIEVESSAALGTTITLALPLDARPFQNAPTLE